MKDKIHPEYKETTISCVCGEMIHTRSTKQNIHVDICSKCHPFFTGRKFSNGAENITISESYEMTMNSLASQRCDRNDELKSESKYYGG